MLFLIYMGCKVASNYRYTSHTYMTSNSVSDTEQNIVSVSMIEKQTATDQQKLRISVALLRLKISETKSSSHKIQQSSRSIYISHRLQQTLQYRK